MTGQRGASARLTKPQREAIARAEASDRKIIQADPRTARALVDKGLAHIGYIGWNADGPMYDAVLGPPVEDEPVTCSTCGQSYDEPACSRNPDTGEGFHTVFGGIAAGVARADEASP